MGNKFVVLTLKENSSDKIHFCSTPAAALDIERITFPTDNFTLCHLSMTDHAMPTTLALYLVTAVQATLQ